MKLSRKVMPVQRAQRGAFLAVQFDTALIEARAALRADVGNVKCVVRAASHNAAWGKRCVTVAGGDEFSEESAALSVESENLSRYVGEHILIDDNELLVSKNKAHWPLHSGAPGRHESARKFPALGTHEQAKQGINAALERCAGGRFRHVDET
jgi:hypothetical protein